MLLVSSFAFSKITFNSALSSSLVISLKMALITAGLVRLYIIHGLKIMLALLGLRPNKFFQKKKKEKKKAISKGGKWKAVKVFDKKVLTRLKTERGKLKD